MDLVGRADIPVRPEPPGAAPCAVNGSGLPSDTPAPTAVAALNRHDDSDPPGTAAPPVAAAGIRLQALSGQAAERVNAGKARAVRQCWLTSKQATS